MNLHFRNFHLTSRYTIDLRVSLAFLDYDSKRRALSRRIIFVRDTLYDTRSPVERDEIVYVGPVISEVHVQQVNDLPLQTE